MPIYFPPGSGGAAGGSSGYVVKTANYTAVAGDKIAADLSGGSFTITLPASPSDGDFVDIILPSAIENAKTLTVARNGNNIDGAASDAAGLDGSVDVRFSYLTAYGWRRMNTGYTSGLYFSDVFGQRLMVVTEVNATTFRPGSDFQSSWDVNALSLGDVTHIKWFNGAFGSADVGFARSAAGVVKVTNGSTGGGIMEMPQVASGGTPSANSARIYSKVVGGTAQVETATVVGTVTGDGNARATVTSTIVTGSPLNVDFAVLNGDTASDVGGKLRAALNATAAITSVFTVSGAGADAILTCKTTPGNDATLNIATDNQTCTGLTAAPTSANTTAGVDGTAEMFVMDEAGNETQISPHDTTAPAHLIDNSFDEIGYNANYYTGIVTYTNKQRMVARVEKAQYHETFVEHNTRLNLTGDRALIQRDWVTVQIEQVTKREAERQAWQVRKAAWEADPVHAGKPFTEVQPPVLVAQPAPAWLTAQLAGRADFFDKRDAALARKVWTSFRFLKRFTSTERKAIKVRAKVDDNVADFELLATAAQEILSDDPETLAGMNYLVSVGVLTEERKNEILSGL